MEKEQLVEIANTEMPFGKYKGRRLIDLPEEYLLWFARKDEFPPGAGRADGYHVTDQNRGADPAGAAPEASLSLRGAGLFLRQLFRLALVATRQHRADHQLDLMENHQRQHHHPDHRGGEQNVRHRDAVRRALLEPQKTMVISSALLKPHLRATKRSPQ